MESDSTATYSRQPSGIRALPSHDDDDDEIYDDFYADYDYKINNSVEDVSNLNENNVNLDYNGTFSGNDSDISVSSSGNDESLVKGEELEDSVGNPDEETLEKEVGSAQNDVFSSQSMTGFERSLSFPVAKVSVEEEDDVEFEFSSGGEDESVEVERDGVENVVLRVRVLEEEEWGEMSGESELEIFNESDGEKDAVVDVVEVEDKQGSEVESVEETSVEVESSGVENVQVASPNQEDSVNVDVVELGSVLAEDKEDRKDSEVEESDLVNSEATQAAGARYTDEGDAVVDSVNVDAAEAVRSGTAIIGEVGEVKPSEVVENSLVEDSSADKYGQEEPKAIESDESKAVEEDDLVVRESEYEGIKLETSEVDAPVVVSVILANEFSALADHNLSKVVEKIEAQTNDTEIPQTTEVSKLLNTEQTKLDTDFVSKESEPSGRQFPVGEKENLQPNNVDDEPAASSLSADVEQLSNRLYASRLVDGPDDGASGKNSVEQNKITYLESEVKVVDEGDSDEEGEGKMPFDSAALAALLRAAANVGTDPSTITVRSQDGSRLFSMERPVGLEPSLRSVRPSIGANNSSFFLPTNLASPSPSEENLSEEDKKKLEYLQQLKIKFLRLVQRAGFTAEHSLAAQVLYKLTMFAGRPSSPAFSLDNAKQKVIQLESEGKDDLDYSLNVLVLGKTGVGKSSIINSIFGEEKVRINAFEPETTSVSVVSGVVDGVKIRFIDAPGLKSSAMEQGFNRKVLSSVKKLVKKFPPDIKLYVDRLDSRTRDRNDLPLLKTISDSLGTSIWQNTVITLTHASSAPPDGSSGIPVNYEVFVAQRGQIVQQSIAQAVGRMGLATNPVSLVENHPACRKNRDGHKILPNGQAWRPELLLLCYSVKILSEASRASKTQDVFDARKLFDYRIQSAPLPYLLSSLLQPRTHPKLSADQGGDGVDSDIDLDDLSDSDQEEDENEYDELPPFKPLRKIQLAKLTSDQKKAYFEEYDYRVKLLQRKQLRDELKRMRETIKDGKNNTDSFGENPEDYVGENGSPAAVAVPLPDMTLPPSFDSDNPAYRYRFLEPTSQFLARPVLDPHGWDHDCGYEGVNVEHTSGIAQRFPASITVQLNKDKKDFNIHLDSAISAKHSENGSSILGFDIQTIGKQYAYIVRGESKFKNLKKNKTAAGVTVTFLGENTATGLKVEDQISLGKRLVLVGSTGTVRSQKDAAYGANMEVRLREADYPVGQEQSSFTLSLMKWRGDLAIGANLQTRVSVGRNSKVAVRAALNNKMSGQITVRTSSSDHMSLALAGLIPIVLAIYKKFRSGDISETYSVY